MIEREQIVHVAKLAQLQLSEAEVERMAVDLSGILDHADRIAELSLDEVPTASHVVGLVNVLREDQPRPSLPREQILEQAPDPSDGAFRVPSSQAD